MENSLVLEDIEYAVDCEACGYPYATQLDVYRCNHCYNDKVYICKKDEE